jgi:hypothetical protein
MKIKMLFISLIMSPKNRFSTRIKDATPEGMAKSKILKSY